MQASNRSKIVRLLAGISICLVAAIDFNVSLSGNGSALAQPARAPQEQTQTPDAPAAESSATEPGAQQTESTEPVAPVAPATGERAAETVDPALAETPTTETPSAGNPLAATPDSADTPAEPVVAGAVTIGEPVEYKWRVGVRIQTGSKAVKNLRVTLPVPVDWPEQRVEIVDEEIPAEIHLIDYRDGDSGVRQIVANIRSIGPDTTIDLNVTFNVDVAPVAAPADTSVLTVPDSVHKDLKQYLGTSPGISFRNAKLRKQVKELVEAQTSAWSRVESIYDWVRENVEYKAVPHEDTISVFRAGEGCAEDLVGLFVAMCRVHKVPARMVWVDGHQYAEFYLVDENGTGHWFPCNVAGLRDFGSVSDARIILQKGDDIKVPEKQEALRYVNEHVVGKGNVKPGVQFYRDLLPR